MVGILRQVQVRGTPQLLFDNQSLLKELEATGQELVLDLQEVAFAHVHFEGLVDDGKAVVILDVLPAPISVSHNACKNLKITFKYVA